VFQSAAPSGPGRSAHSSPVLLAGAESLGVGTGSMVGVADRVRRPGRAAIDAVAASWTIGSEEDSPALCLASVRSGHLDLRASEVRPGVLPGGPPKAEPGRWRRAGGAACGVALI
jgi:hypothetical protein